MTIGTTRRTDANGNDSTATYPYTFKVFAATDLRVTVRNTTTGVETVLTYPTQYSVSGIGKSAGGNVVLTAVSGVWQNVDGTLKTGYKIANVRVPPITQAADIRNQGDFFADVHEDEFDKLTMIDLYQQDQIERSLHAPESESSLDMELPTKEIRALTLMGFDANGEPTVYPTTVIPFAITAFVQSLFDDADAATFRTSIGVGAANNVAFADVGSSTGIFKNTTANDLILQTLGGVQFKAMHVGSSVNFLVAYGAAAAGNPALRALGADTNIAMLLSGKGTGVVNVESPLQCNSTIFAPHGISVGGATPSTTAGGLSFPATQSASGDPNTLDDYEKGTFTPSLGGNTTYNNQEGKYTKIGNVCSFGVFLLINAIGTGSTTSITNGLPFTPESINYVFPCWFATAASSLVSLVARATGISTDVAMLSLTAAGSSMGSNALFQNGTFLRYSGSFRT